MALQVSGPPCGPVSFASALRSRQAIEGLQQAPRQQWQQWRRRRRGRQRHALGADASGLPPDRLPPPPPPPPPPPGGWKQQQQQQQQHRGSSPVRLGARMLAAAAAVAAASLLPGRLSTAAACGSGFPAAPAAVSTPAAVSAAAVPPPAQLRQLASISIGNTSPSFQPERAVDIAAFKLAGMAQRILSANILVKIVALVLVCAPVIWSLGCVYSMTTGSPLGLSMYKIYTVLVRTPGARVTEESSFLATLLMNFAFVLHVFAFAAVIGVMSEEIKSKLSALRHGNIPLALSGHVLVCNWNRQAPLLLRQMASGGHGDSRTLGRDIVVLADVPKRELDEEMQRTLHGSRLHWVTRRGAPHSAKDLETVAAAHAKTVILLHPDEDEAAEVHKTATLVSLQSCRSHPSTTLRPQRVVLQNPEAPPGSASAAQQASHALVQRSFKLVEVNGQRNMAHLIAQSAVQPGVGTALGKICQCAPEAPDFRVVDLEAWKVLDAGSQGGRAVQQITYQDARRKLANAVVCGYVCADKRTHLNPPDSQVLSRGDKLIVLSHKAAPDLAPGGSTAAGLDVEALRQRLEAAQPPPSAPKSIVVVGWTGPTADLVNGLCDFAAPGTEITIVAPERPVDFLGEDAQWEIAGRTLRFVEGDVLDRAAYEKAAVATAHAVILGSLQCPDAKAADARMLTSLLMVQDIVNSSATLASRAPHIVACVQYPDTARTAEHILAELAKTRCTAELLQPGELVSGMLLQVAHEPLLAATLSELIDSAKGNELHLRRPERYGLNGGVHTFAEVGELARLRGETCIGFISAGGEVHLVPNSASASDFPKGARLVVLSQN